MRILKKILLAILALIVLLILIGAIYFNSLKPTYEGTVALKEVEQETSVFFDDYGVPHIYANNNTDALTALGYVHAQDRLWQMELMRRIAPGRLSEIFGNDMLQNDKFFASLGIEEASKKSIDLLDKNGEIFKLTKAYLNGINQFIENGPTPIEFTVLGIEKEQYTIKDVYNILGYMSFSFAMAHKTDPLLSAIQNKLGNNYIEDLGVHVNPKSTLIKNAHPQTEPLENMVSQVHTIMDKLPTPAFIGSNSWVIAPKKTGTGNVLFANDPHIGYSQPAVWYEAHINTPNYEMYGYHLAGVPFPLLGHNRQYAYGLTMFENDDIDFYSQENHPTDSTLYKTPNGFEKYVTVTKTIKVKNAQAVNFEVKNTRHGPIITDVLEGIENAQPIAMYWVYTQLEVEILEALHTISRANNMNDVKKGASKIHAPGLNVMYGDAKGNIAWWAAGHLYKQQPQVNRKFILNGTTGENDIIEFLNFSENPMAENPSWNYVYSANNQPDSISGMLYPGYYLPEDRAKRIVTLLENKNDWDRQAMATMINDVTSSVAPNLAHQFTNFANTTNFTNNQLQAFDILKNWDGSSPVEAIAPTIYNKWIYLYLKYTFEDELGEKLFNQFLQTHLSKRALANIFENNTTIWWDNKSTEDIIETKEMILTQAFKDAIISLENQLGGKIEDWKWGVVHTLEHNHVLGNVAALRKFFNVGPFPIKGAKEVIDNRGFDYTNSGFYAINAGPSTRRIIDYSDVENSISILPTGQSGNPFSPFYKDQAALYNKGDFRKMKMNKDEIINVSTKLTFTSKNE
jgi:penicillin amidase